MMLEQVEEQEVFQSFFWNLYGLIDQSDPLQKMRAKAWERYLSLGLPQKKNDVYRYVRLDQFFSNHYEPSQSAEIHLSDISKFILPECKESVIVLINGQLSLKHSRLKNVSNKVVIQTLSEGMKTYGGFLSSQWIKSLKEETDPFAAINAALHLDGLFIYVPPKSAIEIPIQLLNVVKAENVPMFIMPRVQIVVGMQSELSLISTQSVLSGENYGFNQAIDISIEEGARVSYVQSNCGIKEKIWHFDALRVNLKRDSALKTVNITRGSTTARFDYRVSLAGPNAEALLNGVWMLDQKNEAHVHIFVDHQAPNCRSMQLFKGVLTDQSRSAFEGKIFVNQAAQKTEAFQLNNNLLLSDRAIADSKPNLEIFADDVKASHGATVGQLDQEQIFYMKTRGYDDMMAKQLLVYGFCQEVIDLVTTPSLHDELRNIAENYLLSANRSD